MLLVLLLAATAYVDSLSYQFIWDDVLMVVERQRLRDLRNVPAFLREDFTTLTSGAIEGHYYRPTLAVTLALDATVWGLKPAGFHLTNILLHVAVTYLVSRLALAMGATRDVAVLAALLFGLHPVHVEVVTWVAGRGDLLLTLSVLGCLLAYRRCGNSGPRRIPWGLAALVLQVLALLSKEPAVVLPPLLMLSDLLAPSAPGPPGRRAGWRRALVRSLPFWGLTVLFAAFRFSTLVHIAGDRLQGDGLWRRLPGSLETLARYLWLSLLPVHMQPIYALRRPSSFLELWPALGILGGMLLLVLLIWWWRRAPLAALGVAWFFITLIPVMDLVPFSFREMGLTDRYLYLPSVGSSLVLSLGISVLFRPAASSTNCLRKTVGWAALLLLLVLYPWSLLRYASIWRNDLTLYGRMVVVAPNSPSTHFNLGLAYLRANDLERGTQALERAVRLNPQPARPRAVLALAYVVQGRTTDGFRLLDAVASEGPPHRDYYVARINAHLSLREWHQAMAVAEEGAVRFPNDADLREGLGRALERLGRPAEAMDRYHQALTLRPDMFQAEEALGNLLVRSGRPAEAAQHFLRSAEIRPDRPQPFRALALLFEARGDRSESLRLWRQVLELAESGPAILEAVEHIRRLEQERAGSLGTPGSLKRSEGNGP
jgi:tetratricopeptide (TPR) repeat protein